MRNLHLCSGRPSSSIGYRDCAGWYICIGNGALARRLTNRPGCVSTLCHEIARWQQTQRITQYL